MNTIRHFPNGTDGTAAAAWRNRPCPARPIPLDDIDLAIFRNN